MPLPWTFSQNLLMPVRTPTTRQRTVVHLRVFSDRWAGTVVVVGQLGDQPADVPEVLPAVWARLQEEILDPGFRVISYRPAAEDPFREHAGPDDVPGHPVTSWTVESPTRHDGAREVRAVRCGPAVDVWDPEDYTLAALAAPRAAAA